MAKVFITLPKNFHSNLDVAGCYFSYEDKILFLKRHPDESQGNTWGVPAGKVEENETPLQGVIREVKEEAGLTILAHDLNYLGKLYVQSKVNYTFHMFSFHFDTIPSLILDLNENTEARWCTVKEALKLPLIAGGIEALDYYQKISKR